MKIKAACLKRAGIISASQKSEIERRADRMIAESVTPEQPSRRPQRGRKRREPAERHAA